MDRETGRQADIERSSSERRQKSEDSVSVTPATTPILRVDVVWGLWEAGCMSTSSPAPVSPCAKPCTQWEGMTFLQRGGPFFSQGYAGALCKNL